MIQQRKKQENRKAERVHFLTIFKCSCGKFSICACVSVCAFMHIVNGGVRACVCARPSLTGSSGYMMSLCSAAQCRISYNGRRSSKQLLTGLDAGR